MLTIRLWRALNRPPVRSPLYRRAYTRQPLASRVEPLRIPGVGCLKNMSLIVLPIILILIGAPILVLLYYLSLLLAPVLLPLANTVYGLTHTYNVSGSIVREREQQTYDVLCTAPAGILGMHWTYCTGWIHYHWAYRYALLGVLSIGIVASIFGLPPQMLFGGGQPMFITTIVRALAFGALFVIDYAQTIVVSSLTTLIVPTYTETESNARLWGSSLFLLLQLGVYLPTLLFGGFALPNTFSLLGIDSRISDLVIPLLIVVFFIVLREVIITGLWNVVKQQLSATTVELDAITRVAV